LSHRIFAGREHDRDAGRCRLCIRRCVAVADDHCHLAADQFTRERWQSIKLIVRIAVVNCYVLAFDEASFV
jgi:hypothetical protein